MAETLLTVEHLIKKYGDQVILDDVSLDVKKGEVIVVVGPSGCGKSTLLRCINALEPIQGGVVKLGSEVIDPKSKSLTRLRQKIGMVFQSYDLFPHLTVLDNILLAPTKVQKRSKDEVKEEAMKLLEAAGRPDRVGIAAFNGSFQTVFTGPLEGLARVEAKAGNGAYHKKPARFSRVPLRSHGAHPGRIREGG